MKVINQKTKDTVISMKLAGHTNESIKNKFQISKSAINNFLREKNLQTKLVKQGRPNKLNDKEKTLIMSKFLKNNFRTISEAREYSEKEFKKLVCATTIRNILKKHKIKCYIKQKKPLMSLLNKKKRLEFGKKYINYSYFDWKSVIFSDESKFCLSSTNRREFYWDVKRNSLDDKHIKKTTKFGNGSLMVWGCITAFGTGTLLRIDGNVNSNVYLSILNNGLITTIDKFDKTNKEIIFMQDNAPCHKSKIVLDWLKVQKIDTLNWPAQSPDLNPIENLWEMMDRKLRKTIPQPNSIDELWEHLQITWNQITKEYIRTLYLSMPKRMRDVVSQQGGVTKY